MAMAKARKTITIIFPGVKSVNKAYKTGVLDGAAGVVCACSVCGVSAEAMRLSVVLFPHKYRIKPMIKRIAVTATHTGSF